MPLVPDRTPDRAPLDRYCDELERMARAFALPVEVTDDTPAILATRELPDADLDELAEAVNGHHAT